MTWQLLGADEPPAVFALRRNGRSDFVIAVDHASRRIPKRLAGLGLSEADLARHIAWDLGALDVALRVSDALDAPLVAPGQRSLLDFNNQQPDMREGVHVNLYNNLWGTAFPQWYGSDMRFRFVIKV